MFKSHQADNVPHGSFLAILSQRSLLKKYLACVFIGVPIWFVIGLLVYFSPEFAKVLNLQGPVTAGKAIMYMYIGMSIGDISSGFVSQALKSRRKAIQIYMAGLAAGVVVYSQFGGATVGAFYTMLVFLGIGAGYWALMAINASEQFGVNFRATAATTVPNFVRGSVVLVTLAFSALHHDMTMDMMQAAMVVGVVVFALGAVAAWFLPETFHKDLNLLEGATSPDDHGPTPVPTP
jgi:Ca2+/Na+ antiporter